MPNQQPNLEERKEESVLPDALDYECEDMRGKVKYWEQDEMLMVKCKLRNRSGTIRFVKELEIEVAENIFDQIYLIHDTSQIFGLDRWQDIRINYLSLQQYQDDSTLRLTLLTHFCEELNQIAIDL